MHLAGIWCKIRMRHIINHYTVYEARIEKTYCIRLLGFTEGHRMRNDGHGLIHLVFLSNEFVSVALALASPVRQMLCVFILVHAAF